MRPALTQWLLAGLLSSISLAAVAEPFAYSVDSDGQPTADDLYRIDLATGAATRVGPVGYADVEGLAIAPDGSLYGVDDALDVLLKLDPNSGRAAVVGSLGLSGQGAAPSGSLDYGLAFSCDGRLWLVGDQSPSLWQVDTQTGAASLQRSLPIALSGLASRGNALYGVSAESSGELVKIDLSSGAAATVGGLGLSRYDDAGADFDADGNFWAIIDAAQAAPNSPSRIYRLDLATGMAAHVADTRTGFEGLAIAPPACAPAGGVPGSAANVQIPSSSLWSLLLLGVLALTLGALSIRRS